MTPRIDFVFGREIKRERKKSGMTQAGLAELMGGDFSQQKIVDLERRDDPRVSDLMRAEQALGLDEGTFLRRAGYLHADTGGMSVVEILRSDPQLSLGQREIIVQLYNGFINDEL